MGREKGEKRSEDLEREKGEWKSEEKAIQGTKPVAKTTIVIAGNSPGGSGLKSHNKVVEALKERKLSTRESGGEEGFDKADKEGELKTRQGNEGEIKKEQGLTVAQGLLYPPSEDSLQEMDGNEAKECKVTHGGEGGKGGGEGGGKERGGGK